MKRPVVFFLAVLLFGCLIVPAALAVDVPVLDMEDGVYAIEVTLEGGSGKASVNSPCRLTVVDGQGYALLEWSSPYYDYLVVDGAKYLPLNEDGNSVFEIPILAYGEAMPIIADTTAMGTPHEVNYSLNFAPDGIMGASETPQARARYSVYMALAIVLLCIAVSQLQTARRRRKMKALLQKKRSA